MLLADKVRKIFFIRQGALNNFSQFLKQSDGNIYQNKKRPTTNISNVVENIKTLFKLFRIWSRYTRVRKWVEALRPSQQFFSHVGTEPPLTGYHQYFLEGKCDPSEDRTPDLSLRSPTLYHKASAPPYPGEGSWYTARDDLRHLSRKMGKLTLVYSW